MSNDVCRGDVYGHPTLARRFVVVSTDRLSETGSVIVAEVGAGTPLAERLAMFAVSLGPDDGVSGVVLGWRVNWLNASRLGSPQGRIGAASMELVDVALRAAMDL